MCSNNTVSRCPTVNVWLIVSFLWVRTSSYLSLPSPEKHYSNHPNYPRWDTIDDSDFFHEFLSEMSFLFCPLTHKLLRFLWGLSPPTRGQQYGRYRRLLFTRQDFCRICILALKWKDSLVTFCLFHAKKFMVKKTIWDCERHNLTAISTNSNLEFFF